MPKTPQSQQKKTKKKNKNSAEAPLSKRMVNSCVIVGSHCVILRSHAPSSHSRILTTRLALQCTGATFLYPLSTFQPSATPQFLGARTGVSELRWPKSLACSVQVEHT